ncbi:hypothetical protein L6452_14720 [Arctium lappa]|uniref:Uncharacterized protein n=1 Tax=Arctium lappa TaxID=4217 RepID=A0ACB9CLT3_ARCLA|nr:hypothetical protein L6452_14720 [Arctium lappa]
MSQSMKKNDSIGTTSANRELEEQVQMRQSMKKNVFQGRSAVRKRVELSPTESDVSDLTQKTAVPDNFSQDLPSPCRWFFRINLKALLIYWFCMKNC